MRGLIEELKKILNQLLAPSKDDSDETNSILADIVRIFIRCPGDDSVAHYYNALSRAWIVLLKTIFDTDESNRLLFLYLHLHDLKNAFPEVFDGLCKELLLSREYTPQNE